MIRTHACINKFSPQSAHEMAQNWNDWLYTNVCWGQSVPGNGLINFETKITGNHRQVHFASELFLVRCAAPVCLFYFLSHLQACRHSGGCKMVFMSCWCAARLMVLRCESSNPDRKFAWNSRLVQGQPHQIVFVISPCVRLKHLACLKWVGSWAFLVE